MTENKCPECKSTNIDSFRMPYGPKWCKDCGFRVEQKELYDPFYKVVIMEKNKWNIPDWKKADNDVCGGKDGCVKKTFNRSNNECSECLKDYEEAIEQMNNG